MRSITFITHCSFPYPSSFPFLNVTRSITFEGTSDMLSYGLDRLEIVPGDVTDEESVRSAVSGVDAVIFCASSRRMPLSTLG